MPSPAHALTHGLLAKWLAWQKHFCHSSAMGSASGRSGRSPKTSCAVSHTLVMVNGCVGESWGAWHGVPHAWSHHVLVCWHQVGMRWSHSHKCTHTCPNQAILGSTDSSQCQLSCAKMQGSAEHGAAASSSSLDISTDYKSCNSLRPSYLDQYSPKSSENRCKMTVGTRTMPWRRVRGHTARWRLWGCHSTWAHASGGEDKTDGLSVSGFRVR